MRPSAVRPAPYQVPDPTSRSTPHVASHDAGAANQSVNETIAAPSIRISNLTQGEIAKRAKRRILRFFLTHHAMAANKGDKRKVVSLAIEESVPSIVGLGGKFVL